MSLLMLTHNLHRALSFKNVYVKKVSLHSVLHQGLSLSCSLSSEASDSLLYYEFLL
jgi:hypothetical protein